MMLSRVAPVRLRFMGFSSSNRGGTRGVAGFFAMHDPEQASLQVVIAFENTGVAFKSDLAINQDDSPVNDGQNGFGMMFDDDHRDLAAQL